MTLDDHLARLPAAAKDLKLNLKAALADPVLTPAQAWGTALTVAWAEGHAGTLQALSDAAAEHLDPARLEATEAVAAIMNQNNVYYRFVHLASHDAYAGLPARLRMNGLRPAGVEPAEVELWSLAVSAVNGCGMCIDAHERGLRKAGLDAAAIQAAVRLAAVLHAVVGALRAREALQVA